MFGEPPPQDESKIFEMAMNELKRVQHQYNVLARGKAPHPPGTKRILLKQRSILSGLEKDKEKLMQSIRPATSPENVAKDNRLTTGISTLLTQRQTYDDMIRQEKDSIKTIERLTRELEKEVSILRMKDMDDHRSKKLASISEKKIVQLENKLHVETVKYNNIATEKHRLREDIDTMLIEHELFETAYQQLLKKLVTGKKVMSDLMKLATSNFDQRDDATKHLQALKDRANQDQLTQTKEINKLQRYCGRQTTIRDFMATKGQQRITADVIAQRIQKKEIQKEEMKKLREKYQKILDDIKEFTDQHDIDALTVGFIETQEENFAQFNCLNDMYNEIDEMENQINEINEEIERLEEEKETQKDEQRLELAQAQEDLETKKAEREAAEERLQDREASLDALFRGIEDLFVAAGCDRTPTITTLGENDHVNHHNVMMYLNLIERRTDQLLNQVFYAEKSKPWRMVPCQLPIIKIRTPKKPQVTQADKGVEQPHICECLHCLALVLLDTSWRPAAALLLTYSSLQLAQLSISSLCSPSLSFALCASPHFPSLYLILSAHLHLPLSLPITSSSLCRSLPPAP